MEELYDYYLNLAPKFRIKEEDLSTWIQEKVDTALQVQTKKDEVAAQAKKDELAAQVKKEEEAAQVKKEEMQLAAQARREEMELKKDELAAQARREEREAELEKQRLMLQEREIALKEFTATANQNQADARPNPQSTHQTHQPRLPNYNPKTEDLDNYLTRFERYAETCGWKKEEWASCLLNLLQGEALDVFLALSQEESKDYERVKNSLLTRFDCTEAGFLSRFRKAAPIKDENFNTYINRVVKYMDRWIELASVEKDNFEQLYMLILREQLFTSCHPDLVAFLMEHKANSIADMKEKAEIYSKARPYKPLGKKNQEDTPFIASVGMEVNSRGRSLQRNPQMRGQSVPIRRHLETSQTVNRRDRSREQCFQCGRFGHRRYQCRYTDNRSDRSNEQCFQCGNFGHRSYQCHNTGYAPFQAHHWHRNDNTNGRNTNRPNRSNNQGPAQGRWGSRRQNSQDRNRTHTQASSSVGQVESASVACHYQISYGNFNTDYEQTYNKEISLQASVTDGTVSSEDRPAEGHLTFHQGTVNDIPVEILRDSGCTTIGVKASLVSTEDMIPETTCCITFSGNKEIYKMAWISIQSPFLNGRFKACILPAPVCDLIIGNVTGVDDSSIQVKYTDSKNTACPALTRSQAKKQDKVLPLNDNIIDLDGTDLTKLQAEDESLKPLFKKVGKEAERITYRIINNILHRHYNDRHGNTMSTVILPKPLQKKVISLAHDGSPMSGHSGVEKTKKKILAQFSWPNITSDIKQYVKSCHICQIKGPRSKDAPAPLQRMPIIEEPFQRVAIDLVGPIIKSDRGHTYMLSLVDCATRWAEVTPLKKITTEHVAEALNNIFSRLGYPKEILSDRGTQFMSELMTQIAKLVGIKQIFTSPYHPQTNGMVERFHSTLKTMIKKTTTEFPTEWDRILPSILFCYREQEHASTGFSPFYLMYGRHPRGPMAIVREILTREKKDEENDIRYSYLMDFQDRLRNACRIAQENVSVIASKTEARQHPKSRLKQFKEGDEVLVLLPTEANKMLMQLRGPFKIIKKQSPVVYQVQLQNRKSPFHVNLLRKYTRRETNEGSALRTANSAIVHDEEEDNVQITIPHFIRTQTTNDVDICDNVTRDIRTRVTEVLQKFQDVLTDTPGQTTTVIHTIKLKTQEPIYVKPYKIPFAAQETIRKEVQEMLNLGVVEPSTSPYCSPVVLVKKKDKTVRFCIDFRKLNAQTVLDATNIPLPEELFLQLVNSKIFSSCDLTKAYWQIPLEETSRSYTAFQTPLGLMQWKYLPFGLATAPATFARLMRIVFANDPHILSYFDDTMLHTTNWEDHIRGLERLLSTLRYHGLTAKPTKLKLGYAKIDFLGFTLKEGQQTPQQQKVNKVLNLQTPKTKKQVRSLLGLISYYRIFVPQFATITTPLTDLLQKGKAEKVIWSPSCNESFATIQNLLSSMPILIIANIHQEFVLRTDASDVGIGGVLLQEREGLLRPCRYASRKLLQREQRYPVIERECLAIIYCVSQFARYLSLTHFYLEVDHRPLLCLKSGRAKNSRIMRWALALQQFTFTIRAIPGTTNVHADVLSRLV